MWSQSSNRRFLYVPKNLRSSTGVCSRASGIYPLKAGGPKTSVMLVCESTNGFETEQTHLIFWPMTTVALKGRKYPWQRAENHRLAPLSLLIYDVYLLSHFRIEQTVLNCVKMFILTEGHICIQPVSVDLDPEERRPGEVSDSSRMPGSPRRRKDSCLSVCHTCRSSFLTPTGLELRRERSNDTRWRRCRTVTLNLEHAETGRQTMKPWLSMPPRLSLTWLQPGVKDSSTSPPLSMQILFLLLVAPAS